MVNLSSIKAFDLNRLMSGRDIGPTPSRQTSSQPPVSAAKSKSMAVSSPSGASPPPNPVAAIAGHGWVNPDFDANLDFEYVPLKKSNPEFLHSSGTVHPPRGFYILMTSLAKELWVMVFLLG